MRQLALLRGAKYRPSFWVSEELSALPCRVRGRGIAVSANGARSSLRPADGHVSLFVDGQSQISQNLQRRRLTSSAHSDAGEETQETGSQEQTGTYSEADHEHAVISTFDLLYVKLRRLCTHSFIPPVDRLWSSPKQ